MTLKALVYAYIIGGFTFIPLVLACVIFYTIYTSIPLNAPTAVAIDENKNAGYGNEQSHTCLDSNSKSDEHASQPSSLPSSPNHQHPLGATPLELNDAPKQRKAWLTVRRTFEESTFDGSYVTLVRSFLDARSKDPKRSRPKDMWYVVLKGKVIYLYEDEAMTECEAAIELGGHEVVVFPEGQLDGELFAKRNAICLKPKLLGGANEIHRSTKRDDNDSGELKTGSQEPSLDEKKLETSGEEAFDVSTPWFIFVRSNTDMEDWYHAMIHASDHPPNSPTLNPLQAVFDPEDMAHLVETLDEQPDVIPMRWFNALMGRMFFSYYRTRVLEEYIIGRLMKKLSKVKRPAFLTDVVIKEVSVGNTAPTFSKPMLKELTKEGDAALEIHLFYKGEIRITAQAVVTINLGARLKSYSVKLVLAAVLREMEGNLLVKVKRPPSSRVWYAFTQMPRMVMDIEPVVSDRQITWNMVLSAIETRVKEIIMESVVLPNMDDIAFFHSTDYIHRGGIWADSCRHEKNTTTTTTTDAESVPSTSSVPVEGNTVTPSLLSTTAPSPPADESPRPVLQRAASAEELYTAETLSIPDESMTRAATTSVSPNSPPLRSSSQRRRTWFSTTAKDENAPDFAKDDAENLARGRDNNVTPSSSRSASAASDVVTGPELQSDQYLSPKIPPPLPPRRIPSQKDLSDDSSLSPPRSSPSSTNTTTSTGTPSSFFSTLKARAGDKQALSNSAKAAMKKWSANWVASRGESSGSVSDAQDRTHFDGGDQRNTRPSYADIRRNVEERHKTHNTEFGGSPRVDIQVNGKARVVSTPVFQPRRGSATSGSLPGTSPPLSESSTSTSLPVQTNNASTPDLHNPDDIFRAEREGDFDSPATIHTQPPQPKMMTIPGIHASHRGDVMSMGYVADPSLVPDIKVKAPGIQNVYRLWRNPALSTQQNLETEPEPVSKSTEGTSNKAPDDRMPAPIARIIPPPLPSRSVSTTTLQHMEKAKSESSTIADSGASAALKSIVTQDESRRGSFSGLERGDVGVSSQDIPQRVVEPSESSTRSF